MGKTDEQIQNLCAERFFADTTRKVEIDGLLANLQKTPEAKAIREMQNANVGKEKK